LPAPFGPQGVPSGGGAPATHFCPSCPDTETVEHALVPLQRSTVTHVSFGAIAHVNVQSPSHPVPMPFAAPKSQASPLSVIPSPHNALAQAPPLQTRPSPHAVPSASGVPAAQVCIAALHEPLPLHGSEGVQSRDASPAMQVNVHVASHPSPGAAFASSHSSGAVTKPSPQTAAAHWPRLQIFPSPHDVPSASADP
jgi:hypothetical protein